MGSSQSSSRSNSPSTGFSATSPYNVCAAPRQRVKQLASKAFDTTNASATPAMHKPSRTTSNLTSANLSAAASTRRSRINVDLIPDLPTAILSILIMTRMTQRKDLRQAVAAHTRMPSVHSAASSSSVAYRGGSSLQRFTPANQREAERSTSSSMFSKMGKIVAGGGGGGSKTSGGGDGTHPKGTCDKCDGPHLTDDALHTQKKRDAHPDAWKNFGRKTPLEMGKGGGNFKLRSAKVVRQPGDGNCLFHAMAYGIGGTNAGTLRREIASFIKANQDLEIADTPMKDWVKYDSGTSVSTYASRMAVG
eukprot:CAMPEP_0179466020 /NCGR_PEP_ID=MMETSP0799-20121207/47450_1 /TAXON_ID=46947 /ORGANISM="Geminigera cryophila, Strain CCMP2564" /LENGTH=305 /DNA_ID=CAMNT_0021270613 /DNA_START=67 /DNA_END=980 /DNA_ORIENTATION=+